MTVVTKYLGEYQGADVEQAMANACEVLGMAPEELDIQVVSAGSAGIFGLGRRKAVIRVSLRLRSGDLAESDENSKALFPQADETRASEPDQKISPNPDLSSAPAAALVGGHSASASSGSLSEDVDLDDSLKLGAVKPLTAEELVLVRSTVERLLELVRGAAKVELAYQESESGGNLLLELSGPDRDLLIGPDGQTLDALQYLLRKMLSKQLDKRVGLELDAGGFRVKRRLSLENQARALAAEVKASGKTRAMGAMEPAERRLVHLALQHDREVRSRSVGAGVYKKVLIYLPGRGRRPRRP